MLIWDGGKLMAVYDIALWRYWPTSALPVTDEAVSSESPFLAVLSLMHTHKLKHIAYAAVRLPDGTFRRWTTGVTLYAPASAQPETEEEEMA